MVKPCCHRLVKGALFAMVVQVLVTCLGSPSLDVTLAAMRATSAFIQVCCRHKG